MAINDINASDLNDAVGGSEKLGAGLKGAALGAFSLTEEATGLLGVLSDLGNTLDYVTRNPLLSFTFFERIGRSLQKDIISNLKISKGLTEEQVTSWNKWGTAINYTGSAILSFATKVAFLQTQLRQASIESSRYFNTTAQPFGGSAFNTMLQIHKNQALQTLTLSSEFGKAYTEVTQNMGRLITSQLIKTQVGSFNNIQAQEAYRNYLERLTLYSRAFPEANIPELSKRIYEQFGGYGMTTMGATGAAIKFARRAGEGGYVSTAGVGANINAMQQLWQTYMSKGMAPETAFQAAQVSLIGLGGVKGKAGETLPLQTIMRLTSLYPGRAGEQEILAKALGVGIGDRKKLLGPEGPEYFVEALQKWSKRRGIQNEAGGAVQDIVSKTLGEKFGKSFEDLIMLANLPDLSSNMQEARKFVETFEKLNASEIDQARRSLGGLADPYAERLRREEKKAQNLPDVIGGGLDYITTGVTALADEFGISPLFIQSLVAGGVGIVGIRKMLSLGRKMKAALPALLGGKTVGEIPASILGTEFGGAETTSLVNKLGGMSKYLKVAGGVASVIGTVATVVDMVNDINEHAKQTRIRRGTEMPSPVPLPKAFSDLRVMKKIGAIKSDEEAIQFLEKEGIEGIRGQRAFLPLSKDVSLKNLPLYSMADTLSSTLTYPSAIKSKDVMEKAKKEGEKEGILHVIFEGLEGSVLGEAMVQKGQEAFININLGAVINGLRG